MNYVLITFLILLLIKVCTELWLESLNTKHVKSHSGAVPDSFKEFIDKKTYDKSVAYTLAKTKFGVIESLYDNIILVLIILLGVLPFMFGMFECWIGISNWAQAVTLFLVGIIFSIPSIPLEWWEQFRLEEKFGFNKTNLKLWITDKVKGLIISLILGVPLIALLIFLVNLPNWWLWAFIIFFCFQLLMMIVYPQFIMPLFNKFEPLPEGELRTRLLDLSDRTGFKAKTILVMDGSKRSGHSNAFFTGFGKFRRIVLFDTLMEQLSTEELEAVLAHEIGHYKLGHIPKMLMISAVSMLIGFWVLAYLIDSPWFYEGFGFSPTSGVAPALILFSIMSGLISFWLTPFTNLWSRKHEYEADEFAKKAVNSPNPLIQSLRKLSEKNLSNLTPHPTYSSFYYSHPTLPEREAALKK